MIDILNIVLPIFLVIGAGFAMRKLNIVRQEWAHVLNSFVYYVSLPALIAISFWEIDWTGQGMLKLLGFNLAVLIAFTVLLIFILGFVKISNKSKAAIILTGLVGNTVYMGFPLIGAAMGRENFSGVIAAASTHLVMGLVFSALVVEFLAVKSKKFSSYFKDFAQNPLIISLAVGIFLSFLGLRGETVDLIKKPLAMLGATASPVALFALGGFLHGKFYKGHLKMALASAAIKLLAFPAFFWLAAAVLGIKGSLWQISVLSAAMPTAVTAFVIAEKYRLDQDAVANAILISTIVSIVTISGFLLALL